MERREFLRFSAAAVLGSGLVGGASPVAAVGTRELDRFGGWKGKKFKASGFFRTEHDGNRWWLVTPEGNAFISFGVNHYHAGWWAQDYNRDHWVKTFGAKRPWDSAWRDGFRDAALADLRRLGLNTLGIHTDAPMLTEPPGMALFPYVARYEPLVLSHYRKPSPETYADVVNIQYYARWEKQKATMDRWSDKVGQPFLNCDSAFTVPTETTPNPYGPHAKDQAERAEWTREFMENATARPDFVGWHMCGIIDTSKEMPGKEHHQHQGLMTTHGEFYPEMEQAVQQISSRLYNIASRS